MVVKKSNGKIIGVHLTSAEKKAMDMEIRRQIAEYDRKNYREIDAVILWQLHVQLGFGVTRLKKFYNDFGPALCQLIDRYEMDSEEGPWLCTQKLKDELGIDLDEWEKERG